MNAKEAVKSAIDLVGELFENDKPANIGLEDVVFNSTTNSWDVTVEFSRPWDFPTSNVLTNIQKPMPKRVYKVVSIDNASGGIKEVKMREGPDA